MPGFVIELESRNQDAIQAARQLLNVYKQTADAANRIDQATSRASARASAGHQQTADAAEKSARRAADVAEREAARTAANAERWVAREYKDRIRYEQAKQREIERTAAKAEREARRAADTEAREARRAVAQQERAAKQKERVEQRATEAARRQHRERLTDDQVALQARNALVDRENNQRVQKAIRDQGGGGSANSGRSMLEIGRVVQDFSAGGLMGVVNNIEGLTMALGMGAGLAGVFTLVGVAAQVAAPMIGEFLQSLTPTQPDVFADELEGVNKQIEEMEERGPIRVSVEAADLDRLKERAEQLTEARRRLEDLMGDRSKAETESGEKIRESIQERAGGLAAVIDTTLAAQEKAGRPVGSEAQMLDIRRREANIAQLEKSIEAGDFETEAGREAARGQVAKERLELSRARQLARKTQREMIGQQYSDAIFGDAEKDPRKRRDQADLQERAAKLAESSGMSDVAAMIRSNAVGPTSRRLREEKAEEDLSKLERDEMEDANRQTKFLKLREKKSMGERLTPSEKTFLELHTRRTMTQVMPAGLGAVGGIASLLPPQIAPGVPGPGAPAGGAVEQPHMAAMAAGIGILVSLAQGQGTGRRNVAPPAMAPPRQPAGWRDRA